MAALSRILAGERRARLLAGAFGSAAAGANLWRILRVVNLPLSPLFPFSCLLSSSLLCFLSPVSSPLSLLSRSQDRIAIWSRSAAAV